VTRGLDDFGDLERDLERALCRASFVDFVRGAWPLLEPTRALLPSVALDAVCAALQAVAEGRVKRLAIATCPGTSKSLIGVVAFPAWLLLRTNGAARIMCGSYSWDFASRDSRRCRDLVTSPWFRSLVDGAWGLRDDAQKRDDYWTTRGGRRLIVSVGGKALGERCTFQLVDDALSGADVHSPSAKKEATRWLAEVLPSRLEDPENDPRVIIGQRLAVDDPIAAALDRGWSLLSLPAALAEGDARCELLDDSGALVWRDEREIGEPLVSLLSVEALDKLKAELGSSAFAAQYMQRPADDGSAVIKRSWWRFYRTADVPENAPRPAGCDVETPAIELPDELGAKVITADLTFGSAKGDYAVVQCWASRGGSRFLLEQWRKRAGFEESLEAIKAMHERHPHARIMVEKAANGAAVIEQLQKAIPNVLALKPLGSKEMRLGAIAPAVESGSCYLPLGWPSLADFVEELAGATKHDDAMDACAYAIHGLLKYAESDCVPTGPYGGWYDPHTGESGSLGSDRHDGPPNPDNDWMSGSGNPPASYGPRSGR
jgi:predicted phage terminase large subunit-like protein